MAVWKITVQTEGGGVGEMIKLRTSELYRGATSLTASQEPFQAGCWNRQWSCNTGDSLKVHTFPRLFILANAGV